ncbi:hypothetical protein GGF46_001910 [Coemansia sp. RSA 552]|nr:hypothetical protein GGF46_001910 [Coemansia sp. RSA 552]
MSRCAGKLGELHAAYSRVVGLWPVDRLRPTHCYRKILKQQMTAKFDKLAAMHGPQVNREMARIEQEIGALDRLVASRYQSQFKTSPSLMSPASQPTYYARLLKSIDQAAASAAPTSLRVD